MQIIGQIQQKVVVEFKGRVLDSATFASAGEAKTYKQAAREWARQRGLIVRVWTSSGVHPALSQTPAAELFARAG